MRKFTKGLLMTFIASAMSLGAYAQVEGYFRVMNAGQGKTQKETFTEKFDKVVKVQSPTTAVLTVNQLQAVTLPGTVLYIEAVKAEYPDNIGEFVETDENDLEVKFLRSQGIDASDAVYGDIVSSLRDGFKSGLDWLNTQNKWGFSTAKKAEILEAMFACMKMYMLPCDDKLSDDFDWSKYGEGSKAYYLKSTTPDTKPLENELTAEQVASLGSTLWDALFNGAIEYYQANEYSGLAEAFQVLKDRIHMGHTYYLSAGYVQMPYSEEEPQKFIYDPAEPKIYFANNNQNANLHGVALVPEIDFIGDYSKWILEPIVPNEDPEYEGTNYFAVNPTSFMKGLKDDPAKYYTTLYVDFPMEIVGEGIKVWGIQGQPVKMTNAQGVDVYVVTTIPYEGIVPARQGVVVECLYNQDEGGPAGNCLQPIVSDKVGNSILTGQFFTAPINNDEVELKYYNGKEFSSQVVAQRQLRVLSKKTKAEDEYVTNNPIGFYPYTGKVIEENKAFLVLDTSLTPQPTPSINVMFVTPEEYADGISEAVVASENSKNVYDLQGRLVSNPTKGLYIVNGKKMVIK